MPENGDRVVRISTTPPMEGRARKRMLFITPATGGQEVVALTESIVWIQTHWDPDAHCIRPHFENGGCDLCQRTKPATTGFLAAYSERLKVAGLLPIPWEAWVNSDSLKRWNGKLRGRVIASSRKRPTRNGPVRMAVLMKELYMCVPPTFDVVEAVCRHFDLSPANIFDSETADIRVSLSDATEQI